MEQTLQLPKCMLLNIVNKSVITVADTERSTPPCDNTSLIGRGTHVELNKPQYVYMFAWGHGL